MLLDLLWKGPHIHISSVIFVISMMLMNLFVSPYFSVNITVIPVYFYLLFLRSRKTNTKTKKPHRDMILA